MAIRMVQIDSKSLGREVQFQWRAIFSGAFLTLGFGLFFLLLGNAIGLSVANTISPAVSGAARFWSWIYMAATMVFSYYLGSRFATFSKEIRRPGSGALHGLVSWGLASIIAATLSSLISPTIRLILEGTGPNGGNWLATCVVGLGFFGALLGGAHGKEAIQYARVEGGEAAEEVKKEAAA